MERKGERMRVLISDYNLFKRELVLGTRHNKSAPTQRKFCGIAGTGTRLCLPIIIIAGLADLVAVIG